MRIVTAMGFVARCAALPESRLMKVRLLELFSLIRVAREACSHWIRLHKPRSASGMRVVARDAIALRARMLHLRLLDFFRLLGVASHAQCFRISLCQNDFAVFWRLVAGVARSARKWRMRECLHQLRLRRLMRIVTLHAVCTAKWLTLMRFLQICGLRIVAIDAQSRSSFLQMEIEFLLARLARLVRSVASVAAHIERSVAAAFFRNVQALRMAIEAQVLSLIARHWLQQLIFV